MTDGITLDRVVRRYGERLALDGVTVAVEAGQTLGVFGSNGAGKTTLRRVLVTHDVEGGLSESDIALGLRRGRQEIAGSATVGQLRELYR